jgi:hypothetical protein
MARRLASTTARGYGAAHVRTRLAIAERDGWRCHWCGCVLTPAYFDSDHLLPHGHPLYQDPAWKVASCPPCNRRRSATAHARRVRAATAAAWRAAQLRPSTFAASLFARDGRSFWAADQEHDYVAPSVPPFTPPDPAPKASDGTA